LQKQEVILQNEAKIHCIINKLKESGAFAHRAEILFFRLQEPARRIAQPDRGANVSDLLRKLWRRDKGQDIAEYAVMLAVILVIVCQDDSSGRKQCE